MDELTILRAGRPDAAELPGQDRAAARDRLLTEIAAEATAPATALSGRPPRARRLGLAHGGRAGQPGLRVKAARRLAVTATVAALTAAAAAVGVTAALLAGNGARSEQPVAVTRPAAKTPAGSRAAAHSEITLAAKFLDKAAQVVLRQQAGTPPGPSQFVYAETTTASGLLYQIWQSADGERPGLIINAPGPGGRFPNLTCAETIPTQLSPPISCTPGSAYTQYLDDRGYLPNMPTQLGPLHSYLLSTGAIAPAGPGPWPPPFTKASWTANELGKEMDSLMMNTYLLPAQRAAMFELMAQTPGFTVVHGVRDAIGRAGVAIRWTYGGGIAEIILNPTTYAYLGDRTTPASAKAMGLVGRHARIYDRSVRANAHDDGSALIKFAIVDQAGQQP